MSSHDLHTNVWYCSGVIRVIIILLYYRVVDRMACASFEITKNESIECAVRDNYNNNHSNLDGLVDNMYIGVVQCSAQGTLCTHGAIL